MSYFAPTNASLTFTDERVRSPFSSKSPAASSTATTRRPSPSASSRASSTSYFRISTKAADASSSRRNSAAPSQAPSSLYSRYSQRPLQFEHLTLADRFKVLCTL